MKVEMRPIDSIKPYENNPRNNEAAIDPVAKSIEQFGFRQPIVVDSEDVIIVGHTRHAAAIKLGLGEVPVHVAESMSDDDVKAYRIADNKVGELAGWDADLLDTELQSIGSYDMVPFGFEPADVPDFEPTSFEDQGSLQNKAQVKCPECGCSFEKP